DGCVCLVSDWRAHNLVSGDCHHGRDVRNRRVNDWRRCGPEHRPHIWCGGRHLCADRHRRRRDAVHEAPAARRLGRYRPTLLLVQHHQYGRSLHRPDFGPRRGDPGDCVEAPGADGPRHGSTDDASVDASDLKTHPTSDQRRRGESPPSFTTRSRVASLQSCTFSFVKLSSKSSYPVANSDFSESTFWPPRLLDTIRPEPTHRPPHRGRSASHSSPSSRSSSASSSSCSRSSSSSPRSSSSVSDFPPLSPSPLP